MTYDDVKRQDADRAMREPPWPSAPGRFLAKLVPSGLEDPLPMEALGMADAIRKARQTWPRHKGRCKLYVISQDGSEIYQGPL